MRYRIARVASRAALVLPLLLVLSTVHAYPAAHHRGVRVSCVVLSRALNGAELPACFRPYARNSPWNTRLPSRPRIDAASAAQMEFLWSPPFSGGMNSQRIGHPYDGSIDYGFPYYFGGPGDPLVTVHCSEPWGRCAVEGLRVHIPVTARRSGGCCDHHLAVIDVTNANEYDFYEAQAGAPVDGETFTVGWGGRGNIRSGNGFTGSGTASGSSQMGGVVRISELKAGAIAHALSMTVSCETGQAPIYPAVATAHQDCPGGSGPTPPLGARVWLDLTPAQISRLRVSRPVKVILNALHAYGGFITDSNGNDASMALNAVPESPTQFVAARRGDPVGQWYAAHVPPQWKARHYQLDLLHAVDWRRHLHVLDPCVTRRTC